MNLIEPVVWEEFANTHTQTHIQRSYGYYSIDEMNEYGIKTTQGL